MYASTIATANATASSAATPAASKELGKDAFLKLLMAQLSNQDPLQPVDNQAFIAQLAQFSSVEQLQGLGSRLDTLLLAQASSNQLSTASLVGKEVAFKANGLDLPAEGGTAMQARLAGEADVTAVIQDASGHTVRTLQLGRRTGGTLEVAWDGKDDQGRALPAGHYGVVLSARNGKQEVGVELRGRGKVQGVSFDGDVPVLLVGASRVRLADVMEINQA
jgi:flagellar basal-body rod modification protein FlgD